MQKLLIFSLLIVTCLTVAGVAQVDKGKTRAATTHQLMEGLVGPFCGAVGEGLKTAPADDKAWKDLANKAAVLNEVGYLLMDDGRCPDAEWAKACDMLRTGSASLLAKLEAHDATGAQAEFKTMTQACGTCHKAHKKDK